MKLLTLLITLAMTTLVLQTISVDAQTVTEENRSTTTTLQRSSNADLNRAKNVARQAAERANGGLANYRAESTMHGPADKAPFVDNGNGTWTFTFRGRRPTSNNYTIESVVTVAKSGWRPSVNYNGPIRNR